MLTLTCCIPHLLKFNVTLKHIAEELGLSVMTVSRAINNRGSISSNTRQKVMEKAQSLGYSPNLVAKSLVSSKTYTIGVVVPEISHSFFPQVIRGIEEILQERDYQLILAHSSESPEKEKKMIETLLSKRVDGLLVSCSQETHDIGYFNNLAEGSTPLVFFDRCIDEVSVSSVSVNDHSASKRITEHLIGLGYKKIAHLSGSNAVSVGRKRYSGFMEALAEAGLSFKEEWLVESGLQEEGGYEAMKVLLDLQGENRPEAIVAVNDPAAFGAIEAITEAGFNIPYDFAIVGFSDDIRAAMLPTPLTTIRQPAYEIGRRSAQKIIRLIENKAEMQEKVTVFTNLIVRNSCGAPKKLMP